jgi:hypothetical protein
MLRWCRRDYAPSEGAHLNNTVNWRLARFFFDRENVLREFANTTLRFAWESLAPEVCAMPPEMFEVQGEHNCLGNLNCYNKNTSDIRHHIQKCVLG